MMFFHPAITYKAYKNDLEYEALGVSMGYYPQGIGVFTSQYNVFLNNLKAGQAAKYLEIYNELNNKGYADTSKVPILGVVVYGTKDQLNHLVNNPHIKASSFGVIVDRQGVRDNFY